MDQPKSTSASAPMASNRHASTDARRPPRRARPRYNEIHAKPLPVDVHPLPAFVPSNPISLLRLALTILSDIIWQPASHPESPYVGYLSPETRSVHVVDPRHMRALWESGFFGKGSLSRSEPTWLEREKARLRKDRAGGAEEATNARRDARRLFKLERARLENERIERQRLVEEGKLDVSAGDIDNLDTGKADADDQGGPGAEEKRNTTSDLIPKAQFPNRDDEDDMQDDSFPDLDNQEHLQLTFEEAFFLRYALGVLDVRKVEIKGPIFTLGPYDTHITNTRELFSIFGDHSNTVQPTTPAALAPDNQFILNYVTYHHYRSLGWVVRPGIKFGVDYLLYNRGPVFSHAEFALLIIPSYSDPYWNTPEGQAQRRVKEQKDWWSLHCTNRVQSQVLKTTVLCFVDVPPPDLSLEDIGSILRRYKVREFVLRRWIPNRSRD